jgi:hypothetical protein
MSIRLMSQVWEDTRIESQAELLVLLALADHARDDGLCWPSMRSIAGKARIEERSAQRIIRRLIEKGLTELVLQGGCIDGCNIPNRYRVIGSEPRQTHGVTEGRPGASVSQGLRGDREDKNGVTQGHPNHQKEPLTERITTTHPQAAKKPSQGSEPTEASSSRSDSRAIRTAQESGLLQARVSGVVNRLTAEFALSNKQREAVRESCNSLGTEYVETKADIVRMQPRRNAAGALLAALRDLMWLLLHRLLDEEHRTALFLNAVRFRTGLQTAARDSTTEEFVRRLVRPDVLFWDDLGQMHLTGAASEMLLHLLEERVCTGGPILATTQYAGREMDAQFERPETGKRSDGV